MRALYLIIGSLAVCFGVWFITQTVKSGTGMWLGYAGGSAQVLGGIAMLLAGKRSYRGHWAFPIGVVFIVGAVMAAGAEIDDRITGRAKDAGMAVEIITLLAILGTLSLLSGHKLHRVVSELEALRASIRTCGPESSLGAREPDRPQE